MATNYVSRTQIGELHKAQIGALTSLRRSRQVMRALKNLTETKLEKSLVTAASEALDAAFNDMQTLSPKLRQIMDHLRAVENQGEAELQ